MSGLQYHNKLLTRIRPASGSLFRDQNAPDPSFIRHAKTLDFSLNEIATILQMRTKGKCPCGEVTKIGEKHLRDLGQQIERLHRFQAELSRAVKSWKRLGEQKVSGDAICVLIERTMDGASKKEKK